MSRRTLTTLARRAAVSTTPACVGCAHLLRTHAAAAAAAVTAASFSTRVPPPSVAEVELLRHALEEFQTDSHSHSRSAPQSQPQEPQPQAPRVQRAPKAALSVLMRAGPIYELSYRSNSGSVVVAIVLVRDASWLARQQADMVLESAERIEVLALARDVNEDAAQSEARVSALEEMQKRGAPPSGINLQECAPADLALALLRASTWNLGKDAAVDEARLAIGDLSVLPLQRMWRDHSHATLRHFLQSFRQYVQQAEQADELPPLQLCNDSDLPSSSSHPASSPTQTLSPVLPTKSALLPALVPCSLVCGPAVSMPIHGSLSSTLASLPRAQTRDERYNQLVQASLTQMMHTLYPDPTSHPPESPEAQELLQRRIDYARSVGWPESAAFNQSEFSQRFLRPRRIELHVAVVDTINAFEEQMLVSGGMRAPGSFPPKGRPTLHKRATLRRQWACQVVERATAGISQSPAPFASLAAAAVAARGVEADLPFRTEQIGSLFDVLARDQAILHAAPLFVSASSFSTPLSFARGDAADSDPSVEQARRHVHALFHQRVYEALRTAQTQGLEDNGVVSMTRINNQRFQAKFGRRSTTVASDDDASSSSSGQEDMLALLQSLDPSSLRSLHHDILVGLSRDLDVPLCAIRFAIEQVDGVLRGQYKMALRKVARDFSLDPRSTGPLLAQRIKAHKIEQWDQHKNEEQEEQEEDGEEEEEHVEDDVAEEEAEEEDAEADGPDSGLSSDVLTALHGAAHAEMLVHDISYRASQGLLVSFPEGVGGAGERARYRKDLANLRNDIRKARFILGPRHLVHGSEAHEETRLQTTSSPSAAAATVAAAASSSSASSSTSSSSLPRFVPESARAFRLLQSSSSRESQSPSPSSSQNSSRGRRMQAEAGAFASNVISLLHSSVPGGVRVATEEWMALRGQDEWNRLSAAASIEDSGVRIATPDLLLLDEVHIQVHYPAADHPTNPLPRRATQSVPMRWIEAKNSYGACLQYKTQATTTASTTTTPADRTFPSPTRAQLVEQSSRYAALFGPGCVVFGRGFSDAWLRSEGEGAQARFVMPDDVCFLDSFSLAHLLKVEAEGRTE